MKKILSIFFSVLIILNARDTDKNSKDKNGLKKVLVTSAFLEANNVKAILANNGWLFWGGGDSGFIIPHPVFSSNKDNFATVYASGLWMAGNVNGDMRAAIANYRVDFIPGNIVEYKNNPAVYNRDYVDYDIYFWYSPSQKAYLNQLLNSEDQEVVSWATDQLTIANNADAKWATAVAQGAPQTPPGDVAAWTIYHDADASQRTTNTLNGTKTPMDVQVTMLAFAFRTQGPVNNTVFIRFGIFNKGTHAITNLYTTVWSDPDVGQYTDDYVGSDPVLGLGYAYNGKPTDSQYTSILGLEPPAVGYDFFQGPIIDSPGDQIIRRKNLANSEIVVHINNDATVVFNPLTDSLINDKKVLVASSFTYFNNGEEATNATEYHSMMQGLTAAGALHPDQVTALANNWTSTELSTWFFNGDPEKGNGVNNWIETVSPSDRRFMLNAGPFDMGISTGAVDRFQDPGYKEIYFGVLTSFGPNNRGSVGVLRFEDSKVQYAFDVAFNLATPLPAPIVDVRLESGSIFLAWKDDSTRSASGELIFTEDYNVDGWVFEGYEIVQFESVSKFGSDDFKTLQVYDRINNVGSLKDKRILNGDVVEITVIRGADSEVKRDYNIKNDEYSSLAEKPLINNRPYSFGVRAYAVNVNAPSGADRVRFSSWAFGTQSVVPRLKAITTETTVAYHEEIAVTNLNNVTTTGYLGARVNDPYKVTGDIYDVRIDSIKRQYVVYRGGYPSGSIVKRANLKDSSNYTSDKTETFQNSMEFDGLTIYTYDADGAGISGVSYLSSSNRWVDHTNWGGAYASGGIDYADHFLGSSLGSGTVGAMFPIHVIFTNKKYEDAPDEWSLGLTLNRSASYVKNGIGKMPFRAFDMTNPSSPRQIEVLFIENSSLGSANQLWDLGWDTIANTWASVGAREYTIFKTQNYSAGQTDLNDGNSGVTTRGLNALVGWWPNGRAGRTYLGGSFTMVIGANILLPHNSVWRIQSPAAPKQRDLSLLNKGISLVKVVPNPYYGQHALELTNEKYVKFINLPQSPNTSVAANQTIIRIFSLNGDLVNTLVHNSVDTEVKWRLINKSGVSVGSGVYFAHITFPTGATKVVKMAIFQSVQQLTTF